MGLARSQCAMGAYYRRLVLRMNTSKAITAVAHKLARIIYAMLTGRADYEEEQQKQHEQRYQDRVLRSLRQRASKLGYTLVAQPVAAAT